jgi:hypothetical protein
MRTLVEFPNVVLEVATYLRTALAVNGYPSVRVADTYKGSGVEVWVQRDGGPALDAVRETARIRINVFAPGSTSEAVDNLARRVSTLMRAAADGDPIVRVVQTTGPTSIAEIGRLTNLSVARTTVDRGTQPHHLEPLKGAQYGDQ